MDDLKKLALSIAAAAGLTGAAVIGLSGDVEDFKCPDASYTRTEGTDPDARARFVVCQNDQYTITARENDGGYGVVIYDERTGQFIDPAD